MIYAPLHQTWLGLSARPPCSQPRWFTRGHSEVLAICWRTVSAACFQIGKDVIQDASKKLRSILQAVAACIKAHVKPTASSQKHSCR